MRRGKRVRKETGMDMIDAHLHFCEEEAHFCQIAREAGHENTEAHLREAFARNHIVKGIVMGNRGLSLERHQYPDFLVYCAGVDVDDLKPERLQRTLDQLELHLRRRECVGIKLYPGYSSCYVGDPIYDPVYRLAGDYHKPAAIHTGAVAGSRGRLRYCHPLTVDEPASRFPDVTFVMCHIGNPWVQDAAAVMEKNPNVCADLSGLLEGRVDLDRYFRQQAGYVSYLRTWMEYAEDYGRIMYGTDWPLVNIAEYVEYIRRLVPEEHHEKVFYENAVRIYGLEMEKN